MKNIEIEYRSEIPINQFNIVRERFKKVFELQSHKKRFSVMLFMGENYSSVLYIRTTIDLNNGSDDTEIVHKKGGQASHDRVEITQKIKRSDFEEFVKTLGTIPTNKTLIMQRETVNFVTKEGITVSLIRAKKHAYIEFEKLSSEDDKDVCSKDVLDFMNKFKFEPLDEIQSKDLFNRLDTDDDTVITGTQSEIEKVLIEYQDFQFSRIT